MPKLSVIIVNYNTKDYLRQCLASVYGTVRGVPLEAIIVDNNSSDGSGEMVQMEYPGARLISSRENVGFAKANNLGIRRAAGEYVLLLNSDTKILAEAVAKLVAFLDCHPDTGVVTGRLVNGDLSDQGVARAFPTPINALFGRRSLLTRLFPSNKYARRYLLSRGHLSPEPFEVDWVSGACLMARKAVVEEVGLLDEGFFMYWEDADLCFRIKKRGWRIYCVPEAVVIHYEGKSSGKGGRARLVVEFNRSAYRYYRKNCIGEGHHFRKLLAICGIAMRTAVLLIAHGWGRVWGRLGWIGS